MDWAWGGEASALGGGDSTGGTWSLIWIALGVIVIVFVTRRQTRLSRQLAARSANPPVDESENARRATEQALVNLAEMSRDVNAQLATKIRQLNGLVKEADDRISRLTALNRGERPAEASAAPSAPATGLHARVRELRDGGKAPAEIARATGLSLLEVDVALRQLEAVD